MPRKPASRPQRSTADPGGGVRIPAVSLVDLSAKSDARLRAALVGRIVMASVFTVIAIVGVVLLASAPDAGPGYLGIGLVMLGGINLPISLGGLWRVLQEQRMRAAERRARAARDAEPPRGPLEFHDEE